MRPASLRRAVIAAAASATLILGGALASPAVAAPATLPMATASTPEQQIALAINQQRIAAGLPTLKVYSTLSDASEDWAAYLARTGTFAHSTSAWRQSRISVGWTASGENIAAGFTTAQAAMSGWMGSAGHKANILSRSYQSLGVGYVKGGPYGHYWVTIFGVDKPAMPAVSAPRYTTSSSSKVGGTVTLTSKGWPSGTTLKFQWFADGKAISGATGRSLTVTKALVGKTLTVKAKGTHAVYFPQTVVSKSTRPVQ